MKDTEKKQAIQETRLQPRVQTSVQAALLRSYVDWNTAPEL